jgi:hypothetical protein
LLTIYNTDLPTRAELPTSKQLLRSTATATATATAVAAAAGILVTVVLLSEYGIDPTGAGRALGLTEMGEIKSQLAAEAEADRQASEAAPPATPTPAGTERRSSLLGTVVAQFLIGLASAQTAPAGRSDQTTVTLWPNQGLEVKLRMRKDARATYSWTSTGPVNFDLHGEPPNAPRNFSHSYKSGRGAPSDQGALVAAFDGTHGWFWRNRSGQDVTVTLRTNGVYEAITRP